jgi:hypothetical protein
MWPGTDSIDTPMNTCQPQMMEFIEVFFIFKKLGNKYGKIDDIKKDGNHIP